MPANPEYIPSNCVKIQGVGKTSQDKAKKGANKGAYTRYVTDICSFL
jgi:hypothetical protein